MRRVTIPLAALSSALLACTLSIKIPFVQEIKTGPMTTEAVRVALPEEGTPEVIIDFAVGQLSLEPGAEGALLEGSASYNARQLAPRVEADGNRIRLSTGDLRELKGIPRADAEIENRWELRLAGAPMTLALNAGAYQGRLELGGLALERLTIKDGASDVVVSFAKPNQAEMQELRYETGASDVRLKGLANANFERLIFRGGAGNYTLDFTGELRRSGQVTVEAGLGNVTLVIPPGVPVDIQIQGALSGVMIYGGFMGSGDSYTQQGEGPRLTFTVRLGAGSLTLRNP